MSREQLASHEQVSEDRRDEDEVMEEVSLPPELHRAVRRLGPGDGEALKALLRRHPQHSQAILRVAAPSMGNYAVIDVVEELDQEKRAARGLTTGTTGGPPPGWQAPIKGQELRDILEDAPAGTGGAAASKREPSPASSAELAGQPPPGWKPPLKGQELREILEDSPATAQAPGASPPGWKPPLKGQELREILEDAPAKPEARVAKAAVDTAAQNALPEVATEAKPEAQDLAGDGEAAPVARAPRAPGRGRVKARKLNVRRTPQLGSAANIIGGLADGDEIETITSEGAWLEIDYRGQPAFVHGAYVETSPTRPGELAAESAPEKLAITPVAIPEEVPAVAPAPAPAQPKAQNKGALHKVYTLPDLPSVHAFVPPGGVQGAVEVFMFLHGKFAHHAADPNPEKDMHLAEAMTQTKRNLVTLAPAANYDKGSEFPKWGELVEEQGYVRLVKGVLERLTNDVSASPALTMSSMSLAGHSFGGTALGEAAKQLGDAIHDITLQDAGYGGGSYNASHKKVMDWLLDGDTDKLLRVIVHGDIAKSAEGHVLKSHINKEKIEAAGKDLGRAGVTVSVEKGNRDPRTVTGMHLDHTLHVSGLPGTRTVLVFNMPRDGHMAIRNKTTDHLIAEGQDTAFAAGGARAETGAGGPSQESEPRQVPPPRAELREEPAPEPRPQPKLEVRKPGESMTGSRGDLGAASPDVRKQLEPAPREAPEAHKPPEPKPDEIITKPEAVVAKPRPAETSPIDDAEGGAHDDYEPTWDDVVAAAKDDIQALARLDVGWIEGLTADLKEQIDGSFHADKEHAAGKAIMKSRAAAIEKKTKERLGAKAKKAEIAADAEHQAAMAKLEAEAQIEVDGQRKKFKAGVTKVKPPGEVSWMEGRLLARVNFMAWGIALLGNADAVKLHFNDVRPVPDGGGAALAGAARDRFVKARTWFEAKFPGNTFRKTSVGQSIRGRHQGNHSRGEQGHPLGISVDFDAYDNPHQKDAVARFMLKQFGGTTATTAEGKTERHEGKNQMELPKDSYAQVKQMGKDVDSGHEPSEKQLSFLKQSDDAYDEMFATSDRFQDSMKDHMAALRTAQMSYISVVRPGRKRLVALDAEIAKARAAAAKKAKAGDGGVDGDPKVAALLEEQTALKAKVEPAQQQINETLKTAFAPWVKEMQGVVDESRGKHGTALDVKVDAKVAREALGLIKGAKKPEALRSVYASKKYQPVFADFDPALIDSDFATAKTKMAARAEAVASARDAAADVWFREELIKRLADPEQVFGAGETKTDKKTGEVTYSASKAVADPTVMQYLERGFVRHDELNQPGDGIDDDTVKRVFNGEFIQAMLMHGWYTGAAWNSAVDTMHFDFLEGYDKIVGSAGKDGKFGPTD